MPIVDASVVVDWVAPGIDERSAARRLLDRLAGQAEPVLAPRLLMEEVGNALLTGVRRERWTGIEADASYEHLRRLPVQLVDTPADRDRAWELSRRYDEHPLYDMVYVATAERTGQALITADATLATTVRTLRFVHLLS